MSERTDAAADETGNATAGSSTPASAWVSVWGVLRLVAAAAGIAAIVAQLLRTLDTASAASTPYGRDIDTVLSNFLSFFTIQSNLGAAVILAIGGIWLLTRGRRILVEPRWLAVLLACVSTYTIVTGIVYNLLLRGIELPQGATVPWSNEILHVWVPVFLLLDLLFAPRRRRLGWGTIGVILAYPFAWIVYTLIRGPLVVSPSTGQPFWYPYPFLNPNTEAGWPSVWMYMALIALVILVMGAIVVAIARWRGDRRH